MTDKTWSFASIWNQSIEQGKPDRPFEPRETVWASELGGSMVDRWLKMKATPPSNPPNARSVRKMEAGQIWEQILGFVLSRAGLVVNSQERLKYEYPGLLPVSGRLDFIAGGQPDYDKALAASENDFAWLPQFLSRAVKEIVKRLKEQFPNGLEQIMLEIKSCSGFMFDIYEKRETASPNHKLQLFHYLKSKNMREGHVVYVSRDDARLLEIGVFNPSPLEEIYKNDVETITGYVRADERPPLENPIVFDQDLGKFSANWKISYSNYLTMLYDIKDQTEFDEKYKPIAERWNRVLTRVMEGKDMTENNLAALKEMNEAGFELDRVKKTLSELKTLGADK